MTVSKTISGKCSRSSRSTSWARRVRSSCMVISNPGHVERRVQLAADHPQRVEELDQPLERQVLGLDRHDHPVGGDQRVDADRAERGRAVEDGDREALADRAEAVAQARLGALEPRQLDRGAGEVAAGGDQPEVVRRRPAGPPRRPRPRRSGSRRRRACMSRSPPSGDGRVALRIEVDEQGLRARRGDAGGEVDGGGRLPDSALLVRDRVDDSHQLGRLAASIRRLAQPRGRFFAMPGRRGRSAGVGPDLAHHVEVAVPAAGVGADGEDPLRLHRERGVRRVPARPPRRDPACPSRRPGRRPRASSGEASSARVESRPTARAVTAS